MVERHQVLGGAPQTPLMHVSLSSRCEAYRDIRIINTRHTHRTSQVYSPTFKSTNKCRHEYKH